MSHYQALSCLHLSIEDGEFSTETLLLLFSFFCEHGVFCYAKGIKFFISSVLYWLQTIKAVCFFQQSIFSFKTDSSSILRQDMLQTESITRLVFAKSTLESNNRTSLTVFAPLGDFTGLNLNSLNSLNCSSCLFHCDDFNNSSNET